MVEVHVASAPHVVENGHRTEEPDVLEKAVDLLAGGSSRSKKVAHHAAVLLEHEAGLWLDVGIVAREIVGKELPILKDRVDRLTEKSRLATEKANDAAVAQFEFSNAKSRR